MAIKYRKSYMYFSAEGMKYLTKFSSYLQCKTDTCQLENLREHYHCHDISCLGKTFNKKEEIIRHLKWHKKRTESLNHGFLRFSSSDDCSLAFGTNCMHNRKQTHYHCFQPNCDKVYISTSDVQMHSNYHRKDSAIYQEGFQRYRATEECNADYCMFAGQRTTHFHCRRDNCRYTFKNKADMEKHKSYHIKDLQLARDGFKKFLKSEPCPYERCRFSRICNHIHCVRESCLYVLHSSGQLLSHKRKHERMDSEQAYRRFKIAQKAATAASMIATTSSLSGSGNGSFLSGTPTGANVSGSESKPSTPSTSSSIAISPELQMPAELAVSYANCKQVKHDPMNGGASGCSLSSNLVTQPSALDLGLLYASSGLSLDVLQQIHQRNQLFSAGIVNPTTLTDDPNFLPSAATKPSTILHQSPLSSALPQAVTRSAMEEIEDLIRQNFSVNCTRQSSTNIVMHVDQTEPLNLKSSGSGIETERVACPAGNIDTDKIECTTTTPELHLHCIYKNCEAVIPRNLADISEHMQMHELNRNADSIIRNSNLMQITSIEGFFNRKRGRPPKNRVVEVYNNARNQTPQAIFTSFKLEKTLNDRQLLSPTVVIGPHQTKSNSTTSSTVTSQGASLFLTNLETTHSIPSSITTSLSRQLTQGKIQVFYSDAETCCDSENENCSFLKQFHFHCKFSITCNFTTNNPLIMEQHLMEFHIERGDDELLMTKEKFTRKWECFEATAICNLSNCIHSQKMKHFHCTKCDYTALAQSEMQKHIHLPSCNDEQSTSINTCSILSNLVNNNNNNDGGSNEKPLSGTNSESSRIEQNQSNTNDGDSGETSRADENTPVKLESVQSDEEKISIVRAAGTYFPQNSNNSNEIEAGKSALYSDQPPASSSVTSNPPLLCQRPFCKLKRKLHQHCNLCNQAFSDSVKLEIHRLKHSTLSLAGRSEEAEKEPTIIKDESNIDEASNPQNLSKSSNQSPTTSPLLDFSNAAAAMAAAIAPVPGLQQILPQSFIDNFSMQNLHLAHLALYHQNPFYYQNFYPFLSSQNLPAAFAANPELLQVQLAMAAATKSSVTENSEGTFNNKLNLSPTKSTDGSNLSTSSRSISMTGAGNSNTSNSSLSVKQTYELPKISQDMFSGRRKRKSEDYEGMGQGLVDMGMQTGAAFGAPKKIFKTNKQGNFKIFKDEPIPHGYLKFRFNEDCNFPNCGYRNHQSHFHCCRKDCYYSFCDKTRFVQHTARHERLDKLMGDDFKQYRANMRCGYEDCAYNKSLAGQNNKSSHFHCLKCSFICSDTNKVVAHRRQHSKMEFIRMAGFRKVANNEKCTIRATITPATAAAAPSSSEYIADARISMDTDTVGHNPLPATTIGSSNASVECTYSLKQTHYHCLVCDCSVLSRAQLGSHRHRAP